MEQDDILKITDSEGNEVEIEVLDIFSLDIYPGKEYILYTKNENEGDMVKTYISILEENETEANLIAIEDEDELADVEEFVRLSLAEEGEVDA